MGRPLSRAFETFRRKKPKSANVSRHLLLISFRNSSFENAEAIAGVYFVAVGFVTLQIVNSVLESLFIFPLALAAWRASRSEECRSDFWRILPLEALGTKPVDRSGLVEDSDRLCWDKNWMSQSIRQSISQSKGQRKSCRSFHQFWFSLMMMGEATRKHHQPSSPKAPLLPKQSSWIPKPSIVSSTVMKHSRLNCDSTQICFLHASPKHYESTPRKKKLRELKKNQMRFMLEEREARNEKKNCKGKRETKNFGLEGFSTRQCCFFRRSQSLFASFFS